MTNWISSYMLLLVSATILITLIEIILPNSSNKKYIKFVSGLILIIVMINPISKISSVDIDIDKLLSQGTTNIDMPANYYDGENLYELYKLNLKDDIVTRLENNGYEVIEIKIETNEKTYEPEKVWAKIKHTDGEIQPIVIDVFGNMGTTISDYDIATIKSIINYNYGVSNKNIHINE